MIKKTLTGLVAAALVAGTAAAAYAEVRDIRWGTSRVGSSGHRAVTNLAEMLSRQTRNIRVTVQPTPGAVVAVKGYATERFEGYYGSNVTFYEFANDIDRFKGFQEKTKRRPVQSFWMFTMEMGVGIHARDKDKIKSWSDLAGKRVFTGPRPWDTRAQLERAFDALGIEHDYFEVSIKTAGSLLEQGNFVALGVYTSAEANTAPWITEASLQTDWAALNPSAAEIARLKKAGFNIAEVPPAVFGKKKSHVDKVLMLPFYYGAHLGLEVSEAEMYAILKTVEKNADALAKANKAFRQIAQDMPKMQRRGVESAVDLVEIHPGLAKYMRENGVWDSKWDARIGKAK